MAIDNEKYLKKQNRILNEFSGRFMSNSKWLKIFKILSTNHEVFSKCYIIDIYDERAIEFDIPTYDDFDGTFSDTGIKDVTMGGPLLFKEIKLLGLPASWSIERNMRNQILKPFVYSQNLDVIQALIVSIGELLIERDEDGLKVYGYK